MNIILTTTLSRVAKNTGISNMISTRISVINILTCHRVFRKLGNLKYIVKIVYVMKINVD